MENTGQKTVKYNILCCKNRMKIVYYSTLKRDAELDA